MGLGTAETHFGTRLNAEETKMKDRIIVSGDQVREIFRALNGIGELLKTLPSKPENAGVMYAIMSNLTVIRTNLTRMPRVNSN